MQIAEVAMAEGYDDFSSSGRLCAEPPRDTTAVDFFACLPPELVAKILLCLEVEDVVRCLLVSTLWYSLLGGLEPYWIRACAEFGLPDRMIHELRPKFSCARALLFAALRHRLCLHATPPTCVALSKSYPVNVRYSWLHFSRYRLVGALYGNFKPLELLVDRVHRNLGPLSRESSLIPRFARIAENRVMWAQVSGEFLLCACASGLWSGYDLSKRGNLLYRWKGDSMYNSDIRIGCCEECCVVCVAKLVCTRSAEEDSHWELEILKLGRGADAHYTPTIIRLKLHHGDPDVVARRVPYAQKKILLLPVNASTSKEGTFCPAHNVILQWANKITVHTLTFKHDNSCALSKLPWATYTVECEELDDALMNYTKLNTEFTMSSDSRLIGHIFQSDLHVWDMADNQRLSVAEIHLDSYRHEQMKLVALGHLYSIVGLEFSNKLLIVATRTGKIVACSSVGGRQSVIQPPWIDFISATDEQWLSDVTHACLAAHPAVLYWNKAARAVEGVVLGQPAQAAEEIQTTAERRPWWKRKLKRTRDHTFQESWLF